MALDSYTNLKTAIGAFLDRSDLTSYLDDFIDLAEARHKREIRIREMLNRADLAIAQDDRYVNLPSDFLDFKYLRILIPDVTTGPRYYPDLQELSIHELTLKSINDRDIPHFYAVHEQLEFNCKAYEAYTGEIFYYTQLTALSGSQASNAILARAPDCYLYGALSASAPFLGADERLQTWEALYVAARNELNKSQLASRRGGPLVSRIAGSTP